MAVVGNKMDLFRWGLEPEVVRLDWAGRRTATELWNDNHTSRRFLWKISLDGLEGDRLEGKRPSNSFFRQILMKDPLCASQALN